MSHPIEIHYELTEEEAEAKSYLLYAYSYIETALRDLANNKDMRITNPSIYENTVRAQIYLENAIEIMKQWQ